MGHQNIVDAEGIGLAITGMAIVFVVLILVCLFIAWLPRVLPMVNAILPVVEHRHTPALSSASNSAASAAALEQEIVAAIGLALHHRKGER